MWVVFVRKEPANCNRFIGTVTEAFQYRRLLSCIEIGNIHTSVKISVNVSRKQFQNLESLQIYCTHSLTFQLGQFCWFESYLVNQYIPCNKTQIFQSRYPTRAWKNMRRGNMICRVSWFQKFIGSLITLFYWLVCGFSAVLISALWALCDVFLCIALRCLFDRKFSNLPSLIGLDCRDDNSTNLVSVQQSLDSRRKYLRYLNKKRISCAISLKFPLLRPSRKAIAENKQSLFVTCFS